jgi:hypothetical protein
MPPINQQGSRAGLVTGLVVFVILFVTSSIFAFQFYANWQKVQANYTAYQNNYKDIVPQANLQQPDVTELSAARGETPSKFGIVQTDPLLNVALKQRNGLAQQITGDAASSPAVALDASMKAIKDAQSTLDKAGVKVTITTGGLDKSLLALANTLASDQETIAQLTKESNDAKAQVVAAKGETTAVGTKADADLKAAQDKAAQDLAAANAALDANKAVIASLQADQATQQKANGDAAAKAAADLAAVTQQLTKAQTAIQEFQTKLAGRRVDTSNAAVRQVDGKLIRVPNNDVCYINLGNGDQITPGLTFEVYDKATGVPPIPANVTGDEQLPVGKASIEVTHVGDTSSECRIVHIEPGAVLSEGDPIENLVYDPHTRYNFFVYGNFDLANNGRPNPADAEVIKRLVTQWGGKLIDQINVDTDFVVLGAEPVLPTFTKDDLTAENQKKLDDAQKALDKYQELLGEARALHIPVMNQNRFLYYVGFYDQAKR